jgi:hypothetical protein
MTGPLGTNGLHDMNKLTWALAVAFLVAVAATGAVLVTRSASPPPAASRGGQAAGPTASAPSSPSPTPTVTSTATAPAPRPTPRAADPWDVVRAYYRDVQSHDYRAAWALISAGAVTGQTYQQFVAGYACTATVHVTKLGETADQVTFALSAADHCTSQSQHYIGTDTVHHGRIVEADVRQAG